MTRLPATTHRAGTTVCLAGALCLASLLAAPAFAQLGPKVRVDLNVPTSNLGLIDNPNNAQKLFEHDAEIPYASLESAVNGEAKAQVNQHGDVEGDFSAGYIDYHYKVDSWAKFEFTQTNQPQITVLSATQNKVRIALHTEARLQFKADASATTDDHLPVPPFTEFPDFDGTLKAEGIFKLDATADIALWPTVSAENVEVKLSNNQPEVTITGLEGDMAGFSVTVGTTLGFTPGGLLAGGPAVLSIAALIGSNAAYDAAVEAIRDAVAVGLEKGIQKANQQIQAKIQQYVAPAVASANQVKNNALNTSIPGVGLSVNQLQSQAGASLDVRTQKVGQGTRTMVTLRFDGQPRGGRVAGKVRYPKARCVGKSTSVGGAHMYLPMLDEANGDLAQGMSCSSLVQGNALAVRAFLGGTPPGSSLPSWKNASGQFKGLGQVRDVTLNATQGYFECDFEITGLPKGVDEFASQGALSTRLEDYAFTNHRRWVVGLGEPWILGGKGECKGSGSGGGLTLDKASEMRRSIEDCPTCGPQLQQMPGQDVMQPGMKGRLPAVQQPALEQRTPQARTPKAKGRALKNKALSAPEAAAPAQASPQSTAPLQATPQAGQLQKLDKEVGKETQH